METPTRPQHPWHSRLPDLPPGKGIFYEWGPNYTVDPIVITDEENPQILLIQRDDCGDYALPGGFVDGNEAIASAGRREVAEETGLVLSNEPVATIYQGPVDDPRSTLNAWPETTALLWVVPDAPLVHGMDDARAAKWHPIAEVRNLNLYGSHRDMIDRAIAQHCTYAQQLEYFGRDCETFQACGGHMQYSRHIITTPLASRMFVKQHQPDRFTDSNREQNSKYYLEKEAAIYKHLQAARFPHASSRCELDSAYSLVLDAYDTRDGWHWRAPSDPGEQRRYISDVVAAINRLEAVPVSPEHPRINAAHPTIKQEGWLTIVRNPGKYAEYLAKKPGAEALRTALHGLCEAHLTMPMVEPSVMCHHDLRQSNLAWHPECGVRIVDWSWAGAGVPGTDKTSFLVDLAKHGVDIADFTQHINQQHLLALIGFWIEHATWPTYGNSSDVRDHQLQSAIVAYDLYREIQ